MNHQLEKIVKRFNRKIFGTSKNVKQIENFYLDYLRYATPGMCAPGNIFIFDKVTRELKSSLPILEIGSWCGQSANIITYFLEKYGKQNKLITCDGWRYENEKHGELLGDSTISFNDYYNFVKSSYIRNAQFFNGGRLPHSIHMVSDDFFDAWSTQKTLIDVFGRQVVLGGQFSFCFVDGDHAFSSVQKDFENCDSFIGSGGLILFDDSSDDSGWEGVQRVMKNIVSKGAYKVELRNPHYLVRKL